MLKNWLKKCWNKHDASQKSKGEGKKYCRDRTWKALGGKPYAPAEIWHYATIWLKLNSGCGCHPASWYFCFKDLLVVKEILLAIKRPAFFASFLLARFPFHHLLFATLARDTKGAAREYSWGAVWSLSFPTVHPKPPVASAVLGTTPCELVPLNWGF